MSALAKAGRPADAAFSLLLHVYSSHLHLPAASHSVLLWMSRLGLPPTPIDYTDLVFSFCRADRLADSLQLLDEMRALNSPLTPHIFQLLDEMRALNYPLPSSRGYAKMLISKGKTSSSAPVAIQTSSFTASTSMGYVS
jgi:pentatricopeptide repeat protein